MRIFFDTNVLIAAFLTRGASGDVFSHCLSHHEILISEFVLEEFERVMKKKFHFSQDRIERTLGFLRREATTISSVRITKRLSRDKDDDQILADTLNVHADLLLTGDQDLLILRDTFAVPILSPSDFWRFEIEK